MINSKLLRALIHIYKSNGRTIMTTQEILKQAKLRYRGKNRLNKSSIYSALSKNFIHEGRGVWRIPLEYYQKGIKANPINIKELRKEYEELKKIKEERRELKNYDKYKVSKKIPRKAMSKKVRIIYSLMKHRDDLNMIYDFISDYFGDDYLRKVYSLDTIDMIENVAESLGLKMRIINNDKYGIYEEKNGEWVFDLE